MTMVTGEIDFQDTFGYSFDDNSTRETNDHAISYAVWAIFLAVLPIILSNMLVSVLCTCSFLLLNIKY